LICVSLLCGALLAAFPAQAQPRIEVREAAPGVYAVLQPAPQRFDDSNAAIILLDDGVLVVDTHNSPSTARTVIAEIRRLTPLPVRYVVNTHWHGDHTQGNRAYREAFPGVLFLAHRNTREDVEKRGIPDLAEQLRTVPQQIDAAEKQLASGLRRDGQPLSDAQKEQLRGAIARRTAHLAQLRDVGEVAVPDVTSEDTLTLHRGADPVRLLHFPGHTRGDVVIHLPRQRVLITGDLLDDLPFTGHGSPAALVQTLDQFALLEWDVMIPGHGSVRRGREHLQQVRALFASVVEQTRAGIAAGLSKEDTVKRVDVEPFEKYFVTDDASRRYFNFFMVEAVQRAYDEAKPPQK
jgi:glyoxylase-like metal-dependent hydrolase (beta-lactamase superfamily II)